jgi:hypothetical protein
VCRYSGSGSLWNCDRTSSNPANVTLTGITSLSRWAVAYNITSSIVFNKTVGTNPSTCAATTSIMVLTGTEVTYCYEVTNTGNLTMTLHTLEDDQLGTLLNNFSYSLAPNASTFVTQTATITQDVTNNATWTAFNAGPSDVVSATASASVNVVAPAITMVKTVGTDPHACAATGSIQVLAADVTYC